MVRITLFVAVFAAAAMFVLLGGNANAAKKQAVQQSPCAWMLDIDKRVDQPALVDTDCVLCRCILKGQQQDVFRIKFSWAAFTEDGECDDSGEQIDNAEVSVTRWVRFEPDPQNPCIRGKEDVTLLLTNGTQPIFIGKGVGVVGVGDPLSGQLCCNFDENQAVIHLTGRGHDSFGGPAPKKRCWARINYLSKMNPSPVEDPCSILDDLAPKRFVLNGVEGCICDSFHNEQKTAP